MPLHLVLIWESPTAKCHCCSLITNEWILVFANGVSICSGDYCDVYLTHDSMSVRKAHNSGRNHLRNVVDYYQRMQPCSLPISSLLYQTLPQLLTVCRNRPRESSICHRLHHILICC